MNKPPVFIDHHRLPTPEEVFDAIRKVACYPIDVPCSAKLAQYIRKIFDEDFKVGIERKAYGLNLNTGKVYCLMSSSPVGRVVCRVTGIHEEELSYKVSCRIEFFFGNDNQHENIVPVPQSFSSEFEILKAELI